MRRDVIDDGGDGEHTQVGTGSAVRMVSQVDGSGLAPSLIIATAACRCALLWEMCPGAARDMRGAALRAPACGVGWHGFALRGWLMHAPGACG